MRSEQTYEAFEDIPSTYVVCMLDRLMSMEQQKATTEKEKEVESSASDVAERLESGHVPTLSKMEELVGIVERVAKN